MTGSSRARLFVALDLPGTVRHGLAGWAAAQLGGRETLRLVPAAALHLTLCFIGARDPVEIESLGQLVIGCAGAAPLLAIRATTWLPQRRPRVFALDVADGAGVGELQRQVSETLQAEAGYVPEEREYRPHITVARGRGRSRVRPFAVEPPPIDEFTGAALTLYRSVTSPAGAQYEPVARRELD